VNISKESKLAYARKYFYAQRFAGTAVTVADAARKYSISASDLHRAVYPNASSHTVTRKPRTTAATTLVSGTTQDKITHKTVGNNVVYNDKVYTVDELIGKLENALVGLYAIKTLSE